MKAWKIRDKWDMYVFIVSSESRSKAKMKILLDAKQAEQNLGWLDISAVRAREFDSLCKEEGVVLGWANGEYKEGCLKDENKN